VDTVELNNSFYRLPTEAAFEGWKNKTPPGFLFAAKLSRYITHQKRLKDSKEPLALFLERAQILEKKLGPILVQLPPSFKRDDGRLLPFLKILPKRIRFTFEFRHESWFREEVYALLRKHNASLCLYELKGTRIEDTVTADWVYIRLHGPEQTAYTGSYFDNDQKAYAVGDALRLKKMLSA
jgi:uncharacterized protein YecE (DUF72 family)